MDPYDHDIIHFLKEREIRLVHSELMPPLPPETPSDEWGAKLESALRLIKERTDAITNTPAPPSPRFGQVFDVREASGQITCGVYLTDREWAVLFVEVLTVINEILDRFPHHLLVRYLPISALEYVGLLFVAAAWSARWQLHPDLQRQWQTVRSRLEELRRTRDSWGMFQGNLNHREVEAMTAKKLLRSGSISGKWFYTIEAGPLDAKRWEAWFACGSLARKASAGGLSDTLKVGDTLDELQVWADRLSDEQLKALIEKYCGSAA